MGIPVAHICAITPVAQMVGSNRILSGQKIVNPLGNVDLDPEEEKRVRRSIVLKALKALQSEVHEQELMS